MADKELTKFLLPLGKKKFLKSDGMCMWIVQERKGKEGKISYVRKSGYHTELEQLLHSYIRKSVMNPDEDIETLEDLGRYMRKLHREINSWHKKIEEGMK